MSEETTCQSKDLLVTYLYGEATPEQQRAVGAHLAECEACRTEIDALTGVRHALTHWDAPPLGVHFRVVADPPRRTLRPRWWVAAPLAAAAVLVLAAAAGLARLDIRYGPEGLLVRTGWSAEPAVTAGRAAGSAPAGASLAGAATPGAPWRVEMTALEQKLRREFLAAAVRTAQPASVAVAAAAGQLSDEELLKRVQQLIDSSEERQQRNLAYRVAELSRDFSVQRETDLVHIQQGLGRLEGRTEAEAARAREMMNYIVRVSQQPR